MNLRVRAIALAAVLALGASFTTSPARACSCVMLPLDAARNAATAVFEGRLLRFETVQDISYGVFRATRVWKGQVHRTMRVRAQVMSMCPPHFEVGQTRIVYATGPANDLRVESCSRTAFSGSDARELGPSQAPRR